MSNAHQPKTPIAAQLGTSRTAHLRPIVEFLKAGGNEPASGDEFEYNRDGLGTYLFADSLDLEAVGREFDLPDSLILADNTIHDERHFVEIRKRYVADPEFVERYRHLLDDESDDA